MYKCLILQAKTVWHSECYLCSGDRSSTRDPTSTEPERKEMKTIAAILAATVLSFVAGCNTMEGAGKDVQAGGRAVERAADKSNPTADPKKY